ncbi:MAG: PEP-CTERM sorting domain-containing protein [Pyrinomonadaceae bacterium]
MKKLFLSTLLCLFAATIAQADPFVILPSGELAFNTSFTTQGVFNCQLCAGSGTNSVVFGSGANTVTITFTGVNSTLLVGAEPVPTVAGQIQVVTSGSGFVFPTPPNPGTPLIFFNLSLTQTSPAAGSSGIGFVALGGGTALTFNTRISDYIILPTGPNPPPFTYTGIAYSFLPFTIPNTSGTVNVIANVSAIPEPVSLLLLGSGVGMMVTMLKRKRTARLE